MTPLAESLALCRCGKSECTIPFAVCHCGCGGKTAILTRTHSRGGYRAGDARLYISGHHALQPRPDMRGAAPFKINDQCCRLIPLTQGQFSLVWAIHFDFLSQWNWFARWNPSTKTFYATRNENYFADGRKLRRSVQMHRTILGLSFGDGEISDHKNGVTLDNRFENLRPVDDFLSAVNRRTRIDCTSGCKGVNWHEPAQKWQAHISVNGVFYDLGRYTDFAMACAVRKAAELQYHGEYSRIE